MKFVTLSIILIYFSFVQAKLITYVEKVEICYMIKNGPVFAKNVRAVNYKNENSIIKGEADFYRDLDSSNIQILVNITKCASRELLDFCEPLIVLKPANVCSFLTLKHVSWTPFVYGFIPPFTCPFKKGKVIGYNVTLDMNLFNYFPLSNAVWKIDFLFFENNIKLMEFCTDMRFLNRA